MKPVKHIVIAVTVYLFLYTLSPVLDLAYALMFLLFIIGNILLFYMVYAVLKHGEAPKEKWSDGYWYSDVDKKYSKDA
ncbi:MAG: hypothetical protein AAFN93_03700 [Bacteroidota bacterium]